MSDAKHDGHIRLKRGEGAYSNTYSKTSESSGKLSKIYVDYPKGKYKHTGLIHGPVHSSYEYKVLGDFGSKYAKRRPTRYHSNDTSNINVLAGIKILIVLLTLQFMTY